MTGTHKPAAIRQAEDVKLIHSVNPAVPLSPRGMIMYLRLKADLGPVRSSIGNGAPID